MTDIQLQGVQHEISDDARRALARARKILDMASRPPDENDSPTQAAAKEAERAAAAEKFQAVLLEYNLTQAMVEQTGAEADGRRQEAKLKAGVYEWQRSLWEAVAELNFCLYYCADVWRKQPCVRTGWDGQKYKSTKHIRGKEHQIIGRVVNCQATINLCTYIEAAIEKATRDQLALINGGTLDHRQLFTRFAVSFREGAADDVVTRVNEQRRTVLRQERERVRQAQARAAEAGASGVSDGTSLVLASYVQTEADLNRDHALGKEPGTTTKERAERAAREAAEEAAYTEWAAANPEEAAKKAKEEREANDRYWARRSGNYRGGPAPKARDHTAYKRGSAAGSKIGLDIQAGGSKSKGSIS